MEMSLGYVEDFKYLGKQLNGLQENFKYRLYKARCTFILLLLNFSSSVPFFKYLPMLDRTSPTVLKLLCSQFWKSIDFPKSLSCSVSCGYKILPRPQMQQLSLSQMIWVTWSCPPVFCSSSLFCWSWWGAKVASFVNSPLRIACSHWSWCWVVFF